MRDELIKKDKTGWEREQLENFSKSRQLVTYNHNGFSNLVDVHSDMSLEAIRKTDMALWKVWRN